MLSAWQVSLLLACGVVTLASPILPLCLRDLRRELRRRRRRAARRAALSAERRTPGGAS